MVRYLLGGAGILAGLILVYLTLAPTEYLDTTLQLNNNQTQTISNGIADRAVHLRLPRNLSAGKPTLFEMTLLPSEDSSEGSVPSIVVEGRLDLPGVETFPDPVSEVTYVPGQTISYRWLVTAGSETSWQGRLWLAEIGLDSTGKQTRTVLLAYPLELEQRRVVGLPTLEARWIGGGFAGIGLSLVLLERQARSSQRKKRSKNLRSL